MSFPTLVYRSPGPHRGPDASSYDYAPANDEAMFEELLSQGWHETLDDALGVEAAADAIEAADMLAEAVDAIDEPAREVLEAEARKLGVGFNSRTTDKVLAERIAARKDEQ